MLVKVCWICAPPAIYVERTATFVRLLQWRDGTPLLQHLSTDFNLSQDDGRFCFGVGVQLPLNYIFDYISGTPNLSI